MAKLIVTLVLLTDFLIHGDCHLLPAATELAQVIANLLRLR